MNPYTGSVDFHYKEFQAKESSNHYKGPNGSLADMFIPKPGVKYPCAPSTEGVITGSVSGAVLGGMAVGPPGAVLGGFYGGILGASVSSAVCVIREQAKKSK